MEGRLEHQLKIESDIQKTIQEEPSYIKEYYYSLTASQKQGTTCRTYINYVLGFLKYLKENGVRIYSVKDITLEHVSRYMSSLRYVSKQGKQKQSSHSYRANVWSALNSFFQYYYIKGEISKNPMTFIERDSDTKDQVDRKILNFDEISKMIENIEAQIIKTKSAWLERDLCIILLFVFTGMRLTALTEINIKDVDIQQRTLKIIDKNERTHFYPLNDKIIFHLNKWIVERDKIMFGEISTDALFISQRRKRISDRTVRTLVYKYTGQLGEIKKLSPHKLRGSYITNLYNETKDIYFVQKCVGHRRSETTERYIKNDVTEQKQTALQIMENNLKNVK